jgi:hypothetical protein
MSLACAECGIRSDREASRWQGHLVEADDDERTESVEFFCPACAKREFSA